MSSRSGYTVPPRQFDASYNYYGSSGSGPSGSSEARYNEVPKLLASSYYDNSSPEPSPAGKKNKKKKKKSKKLTPEEIGDFRDIFLDDNALLSARKQEKKKSKRKKHKGHISDISAPESPIRENLSGRDGFSPPRKKPREVLLEETRSRNSEPNRSSPYHGPGRGSPPAGYHRGSRSPFRHREPPPFLREQRDSPFLRERDHRDYGRDHRGSPYVRERERDIREMREREMREREMREREMRDREMREREMRDQAMMKDVREKKKPDRDIPSAYADRRSPPRSRNRSSSRSPNTIKLNLKREKIRKKLAALNREEEKIAEEARKKEVEENEVHRAEEDRKRKEIERRNIAIAAAGAEWAAVKQQIEKQQKASEVATNGTHHQPAPPAPPEPVFEPPSPARPSPTPAPVQTADPPVEEDELPVPPPPAPPILPPKETLIPGFGDRDIVKDNSPNIDAILRSNRENSPENPHYKIDEDEGIKQFKILDKIGEGTYGQVYKARHNSSGDIVALKKVRCDNGKEDSKNKEGFPITAVREIKILKQLQHKNIISLKAIVTERLTVEDYRRSDASIYLVFEYMDHDLVGLLDSGLVKFGEREIKLCMRQLFEGLAYCHSKNFLHRDIKCANVLLNNRGEVKLADLGLARYWREDDPTRLYTNKVITRWYRPPELLLGEEHYGPAVDIWSSGCILGELFAKRALFRARSDQEQLEIICRICGSPSAENWPNVVNLSLYSSLIEYNKKKYPRIVRKEYCYFPEGALDLVDKTLSLDPEQRLTAEECLNHPFLADVDLNKEIPMQLPSQDCHEMRCKELRRKEKKRLAEGGAQYRGPHHPPVPHNRVP